MAGNFKFTIKDQNGEKIPAGQYRFTNDSIQYLVKKSEQSRGWDATCLDWPMVGDFSGSSRIEAAKWVVRKFNDRFSTVYEVWARGQIEGALWAFYNTVQQQLKTTRRTEWMTSDNIRNAYLQDPSLFMSAALCANKIIRNEIERLESQVIDLASKVDKPLTSLHLRDLFIHIHNRPMARFYEFDSYRKHEKTTDAGLIETAAASAVFAFYANKAGPMIRFLTI
jgi:hypothetical protein